MDELPNYVTNPQWLSWVFDHPVVVIDMVPLALGMALIVLLCWKALRS